MHHQSSDSPVASLPMYDWPEVGGALDALWRGIADELRDAGIAAPDALSRYDDDASDWLHPDLVLGQTCGWPYISRLKGRVTLLGPFIFDRIDCPPGAYDSVIIAADHLRAASFCADELVRPGVRIAVNGTDSQSGFRVWGEWFDADPATWLAPGSIVLTGSHRASVRAVAGGKADYAAIDAVAWRLARDHEREAADKVVIAGRSRPRPGLPLISSLRHADRRPAIIDCVTRAIDKLAREHRRATLITGIKPAEPGDYEVLKSFAA